MVGTSVGSYYSSYRTIIGVEPSPEKYDSDRDGLLLTFDLELISPLFGHERNLLINAIVGGSTVLNGPQYDDNYADIFVGVELRKGVLLGPNYLDFS